MLLLSRGSFNVVPHLAELADACRESGDIAMFKMVVISTVG